MSCAPAGGALGAAAAGAAGEPLPRLSTSALVIRPPRAVPWIDERSTPSAAATRRATGEALAPAPLPAGAGAVGPLEACAAPLPDGGAAAGAPAPAPTLIRAMT